MTAICLATMLLVIINTIGNGLILLQKDQAASSCTRPYYVGEFALKPKISSLLLRILFQFLALFQFKHSLLFCLFSLAAFLFASRCIHFGFLLISFTTVSTTGLNFKLKYHF